jgi:hypothetical protein
MIKDRADNDLIIHAITEGLTAGKSASGDSNPLLLF